MRPSKLTTGRQASHDRGLLLVWICDVTWSMFVVNYLDGPSPEQEDGICFVSASSTLIPPCPF